MEPLKTDYKNYSFFGNKKFNVINNDDGSVSFEDVTEYSVIGDEFGADDLNATNQRVNEMNIINAEQDGLNSGESVEFVAGNYFGTTIYGKYFRAGDKLVTFDLTSLNISFQDYVGFRDFTVVHGRGSITFVHMIPNAVNGDIAFPEITRSFSSEDQKHHSTLSLQTNLDNVYFWGVTIFYTKNSEEM